MKVTKERAAEVLAEVRKTGEMIRSESIGRKMKVEEYTSAGWTYIFLFCDGALCKIEESNHRELIECWVK